MLTDYFLANDDVQARNAMDADGGPGGVSAGVTEVVRAGAFDPFIGLGWIVNDLSGASVEEHKGEDVPRHSRGSV